MNRRSFLSGAFAAIGVASFLPLVKSVGAAPLKQEAWTKGIDGNYEPPVTAATAAYTVTTTTGHIWRVTTFDQDREIIAEAFSDEFDQWQRCLAAGRPVA